jgi:ribosomal protein S18 acetylase RimI-like enzyme
MSVAGGTLRREGVTRTGRPFVIRPTRDTDAPELAALIDAVAAEGEFLVAVPGERDTIRQSARIASIVQEGGLSLTLEVDGALAGNVMVHRRAGTHYSHVAEIAIVVSNTFRREGFGRALMEMAIAWSQAVGVAKLSLQVFPDNVHAIALYRSLEFVDEGVAGGEVRMPSGDRDVLLMARALSVS